MRFLPKSLTVHRLCPQVDANILISIGRSRDGMFTHLAHSETVSGYERMRTAAAQKGISLHIIWAYRDPILQHEQFEEAKRKHGPRNGIKWLAPPGFSEHQTGWVLDIGDL